MSPTRTLSVIAVVTAVVVGAALRFADTYTRFQGMLPLIHAGSSFGFNFADIPDLTGRTIVVTGANSGLGFGTVVDSALHGATVVMTCRTLKKCEDAKREILADPRFAARASEYEKRLIPMEANLSSLKSVMAFCKAYKASNRPIHSLILNAGIMVPPLELTEDGIESQFGVNHVAHFLMTRELLDIVVKSQPSTIVPVSSLAHFFAPAHGFYRNLTSLNDPANYDPNAFYGQSKLANILFARSLVKRLKNEKVWVNSVHPGGVRGGLNKYIVDRAGPLKSTINAVNEWALRNLYWDEETGALTTLAAAVGPRVQRENLRNEYFVPIGRVGFTSAIARSDELAEELWAFTERILKEKGF